MLSFRDRKFSIRFPTRNFRDLHLVTPDSSRKTCPAARCASTENTVCQDTDLCSKHLVTFSRTLQ
jgi:hypothetical protein